MQEEWKCGETNHKFNRRKKQDRHNKSDWDENTENSRKQRYTNRRKLEEMKIKELSEL